MEEYLHALHAPSRNAAMHEINPTETELKDKTDALAAIKQDIAQLRQVANVKEYMDALEKLKALHLVKPFQGDNTALLGMSNA